MVNNFSLIFAVFILNIAMVIIILLRRYTTFVLRHSTTILVLVAFLAALRMVMPIESHLSIVIRSYTIVPIVMEVLSKPTLVNTISIGEFLLFIWMCGSFVFILIEAEKVFRSKLHRKKFIVVNSEQVDRISKKAELKNAKVITSTNVHVPHVTGLFKAYIFLPAIDIADDELELILKHEMQHFCLHDAWIKIFYFLLQALFWWNPIIHVFQNELDRVLELRCDAALVKNMNEEEKASYLESIILIVKSLSLQTKSIPSLALGFARAQPESFLVQRFNLIADSDVKNMTRRQIVPTVLVCAIFLASFLVVIQPASFPPEEELQGVFEITSENAYIVIAESGQVELYLNGQFYKEITEDLLKTGIFDIPILE